VPRGRLVQHQQTHSPGRSWRSHRRWLCLGADGKCELISGVVGFDVGRAQVWQQQPPSAGRSPSPRPRAPAPSPRWPGPVTADDRLDAEHAAASAAERAACRPERHGQKVRGRHQVCPSDCRSKANAARPRERRWRRGTPRPRRRERSSHFQPQAPPNGVIEAPNTIRSAVGRRPVVATLELAAGKRPGPWCEGR
jgi:hypothetical protein